MAAENSYIDWPGQSNRTYRYWFLSDHSASGIKAEAGNYMFVRPANQGWVPVYVGISDDLRSRLPNHEVWDAARKAGATQIMGHTQPDRGARENEERDLILRWQPPLNTQHRKVG